MEVKEVEVKDRVLVLATINALLQNIFSFVNKQT